MSELTAQELVERIERARDWANNEATRISQGSNDAMGAALRIRAVAFHAVASTLDEILNPRRPEDSS